MDGSGRAEIVISGDGDAPVLTVDGLSVEVPTGRDPMLVGIELVATTAERHGRPVPATVVADDGNWQWRMLVHPDGTTSDDTTDGDGWPARRRPSRLAVAAIGVVLVGGGLTAVAVVANSGHGTGSAIGAGAGVPTFSSSPPARPTGGPLTPSLLSPASPEQTAPPAGAQPAGPQPAGPQPAGPQPAGPQPAGPQPAGPQPRPVAPAGVPTAVPSAPVADVARPSRPSVPAARRTPAPVAAPAPPAGRVVVISDGAGHCATSSGSAVSAGSCTAGAAQWTATAAGELRQGGRCLVTRSGVAVVDCASVAASARTWTPTSPTPGLVNPASSLCLSAAGSTVVAAQCGTGRSLRLA